MKRLLISLVLFAFASSVGAAELGKRGKKEYMGACGVSEAGLIYAMTNGSNAASCDAAQAVGDLRIYCSCTPDGEGGYAWGLLDAALGGEAVDLSGYALLAGDADGQTIQGVTGADKPRIDMTTESTSIVGTGVDAPFTSVNDDSAFMRSVGGASAVYANPGNVYLTCSAGPVQVSAAAFNVTTSQTPPTNANDACTAGDTIDTATFHYYCHATDTWVRVAMATW